MYDFVTERRQICLLQERFEEALKQIAEGPYHVRVGHKGGSWFDNPFYSSKLDIWFIFKEESNRYWNAFGLGDPNETTDKNIVIVVEINFPFSGRDRRIAGVFAKDEDSGKILVCHSGKIGGGRVGIGRGAFLRKYSGEKIPIGGEKEEFALIGELFSENFPERVKDFVIKVDRIKGQLSG